MKTRQDMSGARLGVALALLALVVAVLLLAALVLAGGARAEQNGVSRRAAPGETPPDMVALATLENLYDPVHFDHRLHSEMAELDSGCAACHHETPEGERHPACSTCHKAGAGHETAAMPGLKGAYHRQCLSCHREWSGHDDCEVCHAPKASTTHGIARYAPRTYRPCKEPPRKVYETTHEGTPYVTFFHANHAKQYGLLCADCHQEDPCVACHYQGRRPVSAMAPNGDLMHYKCAACHEVEAEDNCGKCHAAQPEAAFDHARASGWSLAPYHTLLTCASCHPPEELFGAPEAACDGCHGDWNVETFDHTVVGLRLDDNHRDFDCMDCHAERRFEQPPACIECHDEKQYPRDRPGEVVPGKPRP